MYRVTIKKGFEIFQFEFEAYCEASAFTKTLLLSSVKPIEVTIDYIKPEIKMENILQKVEVEE